MIHREDILEYNAETVDLSKRGVSEWSLPAEATVPGDPWAPSAPTISAAAADQAIDLTLTRPATNVDGTTCTDFKEFRVYYSASPGININTPSTYDGTFYTASTSHTYPTPSTTYFVATAVDRNNNESSASSEVSATPTSQTTTPAVDDYTSNIANVYIGDGMLGIEFQPPKSSWVRWAGWKLYYDVDTGSGWSGTWTEIYIGSGPGFLHKGLTTTYDYKYKLAVLGEDGTETSGTVSDNSGAGYTPNATDNSNLVAITIFAENIVATNEVRAAHIKAGTITGDKISSATTITAGSGDNVGVLDGADATWRIYAGSATPSSAPFRVDQTGALYASNATISGTVTIGAGSSGISNLSDAGDLATLDVVGTAQIENLAVTNAKIDDLAVTGAKIANATITNAKIHDISADKITTGTLDASVVNVTNLNASNITSGTLDASIVNVTNLNADNITAGTLTGRVVRTAASGARVVMAPADGGYTHVAHWYDTENYLRTAIWTSQISFYNESAYGHHVVSILGMTGQQDGTLILYNRGGALTVTLKGDSTPSLEFDNASATVKTTGSSADLTIQATGDVILDSASGKLKLNNMYTSTSPHNTISKYLAVYIDGSIYYVALRS